MKAMVIYDSQYGNTAQVAQAIAAALGQALEDPGLVALHRVGEASPDQLVGLDLLVVGSPTQRFRATSAMKDFLKSIPKNALAGVKVAGFDTRLTEEELHAHGPVLSKMVDWFGYAAEPISHELEKKGGQVAAPAAGFYVEDTEGPLLPGELDRAAAWARQLLAQA